MSLWMPTHFSRSDGSEVRVIEWIGPAALGCDWAENENGDIFQIEMDEWVELDPE